MSWLFVILAFLLASVKKSKPKYQKVSVIIPAYNEENTVAIVVDVIKRVPCVDEIVVVDDGSSDNTAQEAMKAGAIVISHEVNKGKGEALYTGYKNVECDIIAFIDADIHNLTVNKVASMIKPILTGKAEITKTKFARESGRVTELTAKPLLNFFFPEISFEQPLSGQFAARKNILKKIHFEKDYGVDVGIVIDADVLGISIMEVDIGAIEHDMSPLTDLHLMANEVVRTIMNRANKYGRVTMIDDIGLYIRMSIVGLSLVILGLFTIFFVKFIPLSGGVLIAIIGLILALYYIVKVIIQSIMVYKKTPGGNVIKSFVKIHFPLIISLVILILMISTFLGAATFENGSISVEPNSRNLIIFTDGNSNNNSISVRGPYTVGTAIENESNVIRMPPDAMMTFNLKVNDTIVINGASYIINQSSDFEQDILRLPINAKNALHLDDGDIIQNSRIIDVFDKSVIHHELSYKNISYLEKYMLSSKQGNSYEYQLIVDNVSVATSTGVFHHNESYYISADDTVLGTFTFKNSTVPESQNFTYGEHQIQLKLHNNTVPSKKHFESNFVNLKFK